MRRQRLPIVIALGWVRLYTAPLAAPHRTRRRAEVHADVWDHLATGASASEVLARLFRGAAEDVAWSLARTVVSAHPVRHPRGVAVLGLLAMPLFWLLALAGHKAGGLREELATGAYWMFFVSLLGLAMAAAWWAIERVTTGRRRPGL